MSVSPVHVHPYIVSASMYVCVCVCIGIHVYTTMLVDRERFGKNGASSAIDRAIDAGHSLELFIITR